MGLWENEIKELMKVRKRLRNGTVSQDEIELEIKLCVEAGKHIDRAFKLQVLKETFKKSPINDLIKQGIIGDNQLIDLSPEEIGEEKVLCPLSRGAMSREQCLEFSGMTENLEDCKNCDNFAINRRLLVGPPLHTA